MAGKVLQLTELIEPDQLGCQIANSFINWNLGRQTKITQWDELKQYVFAVDTTTTTNSKLPWKNKTTLPKLTQIRDNLFANYMAAIFPKRKWLTWIADEKQSASVEKRDAIVNYMGWVVDQPSFKFEIEKLILDYIDYGNCFSTVEWHDKRPKDNPTRASGGYIGPVIRRISPMDIVFNPIAANFESAPKIVRSLISLGEVKEMLEKSSTPEDAESWLELWKYLTRVREGAKNPGLDNNSIDKQYQVDGFTSFQHYLESDYCEVLTFYGDIYDKEKDEFLRNQVIQVVDRHKVISKKDSPSIFDHPPIFHVGWRKRQDNLWSMGPLDNLVGLQYRVDHIENLKADVFDLIAYPVLKIKGYVRDFEWEPMARIVTDEEGDVTILAPPFQVLDANKEIGNLAMIMEEMAGSPKEAMGFRTPGEKTAYEVQRLENAASRIFQNKINQFEEQKVEKLLNACLELARRNMPSGQEIPVFDDEFKAQVFQTLSPSDITGVGRIRPLAARHFAEQAELVQNLNAFFSSPLGQDPAMRAHFSTIKLAEMFEKIFAIGDYEVVKPYVALSEAADAQRVVQVSQEQTTLESMTPSGLSQDDTDMGGQIPPPAVEGDINDV